LQFPPLQLKLATPFEVILGWPISQRPLLRKKGRSAKTFSRRSKSNTLCGLLGWAAFPSNLWLLSVVWSDLIINYQIISFWLVYLWIMFKFDYI
jgi:hypothetical protein